MSTHRTLVRPSAEDVFDALAEIQPARGLSVFCLIYSDLLANGGGEAAAILRSRRPPNMSRSLEAVDDAADPAGGQAVRSASSFMRNVCSGASERLNRMP
ncbi:hypothetical protein ACQPWW_13280 [Micromonospora sp. CA-240977]|uniref:hypothetical protein n=1 Tax=Micromonospora sp. CA-240977 TaxID=3239957 RepID=UPI003D8D9618